MGRVRVDGYDNIQHPHHLKYNNLFLKKIYNLTTIYLLDLLINVFYPPQNKITKHKKAMCDSSITDTTFCLST